MKSLKLTVAEEEKLRAMGTEEVEKLMQDFFPISLEPEFKKLQKEKGLEAADKWVSDLFSAALAKIVLPEDQEAARVKIEADRKDRERRTETERVNRGQTPDEELFSLTIRKIIQSKIAGEELTYAQALKLTQEENPLLAAAILGQMNEFRRRPPRPWEQ